MDVSDTGTRAAPERRFLPDERHRSNVQSPEMTIGRRKATMTTEVGDPVWG